MRNTRFSVLQSTTLPARASEGKSLTVKSLAIVIPALNEAQNLPGVLRSIPRLELRKAGWSVEVIVVDNASTDDTAVVARMLGARVVSEPHRGYGNAYRAGFKAATAKVIATGDADGTYPFDDLPRLLKIMEEGDFAFLTTNRLKADNSDAMKVSHIFANHILSALSRILFRNGIRDSQSGMWILKREIWTGLDVRSSGMSFSQEIKNSAWRAGFHCLEVAIDYRMRGGETKLNPLRDGMMNIFQLLMHRLRDTCTDDSSWVSAKADPKLFDTARH